MAIAYHIANPDIVKIILLGAFIILILAGIQLRKQKELIKKSSLFILSGFLVALWYLIFFFIPAYMFTTPPTAEEIQFTEMYGLIWFNIVPGIILIISLGVINIIVGLNNKEDYGFYMIISGIIFIISILLGFINDIASSIIMAISLLIFLYFSVKNKAIYLSIFCVLYLFSLIFPLIMPDHYIIIF